MTGLDLYTVNVYLYHSVTYASVFLPSSYKSIPNLRLPNPAAVFLPNSTLYERLGGYILRGEYPASTTLFDVKQLLLEQFDIPLSIQSHFKDFSTTSNNRYDEGRDFGNETTLREVWEDMHEEDHEDWGSKSVLVTLATTAGRLWEMDDRGTRSVLAAKLIYWRHYAAGLRYLRNKGETYLSSGKRGELDTKLGEYERLERSTGEEIRKSLWDWYKLVEGVVEQPFQERETLEARAQDIESGFRLWMEHKKKLMEQKQEVVHEIQKQEQAALEVKRQDLYKAHPGLGQGTQQRTRNWRGQESNILPATQESLLKFNFPPSPPGQPQTISLPLRDSLDRPLPESSSFTIKSGILLWGQLHTVFAGSVDPTFQGNAEDQPAMLPGGTIKQYPLRYRSAARNGQWKVRKIFSTKYCEGVREAAKHFGWILYHEDVNALEAVERCDRITSPSGLSHGNDHVDKDVLNVNRYDWAQRARISTTNPNFESQYRAFLHSATGAQLTDTADFTPQEISEIESLQSRKGSYMVALDAAHFSPQFMATLVRDCPTDDTPPLKDAERIFAERDGEGDNGFGVFVSRAGVEYEFGKPRSSEIAQLSLVVNGIARLLFSGRKHDLFPEADELIAIGYDASYGFSQGFDFAVEEDPEDGFILVPETVGN
ncbi:MAG: hypothetical protein Q9213_003277 [Squamulea squamosa]